MSGLMVYANKSFADIQLTCDWDGESAPNCYSNDSLPIMGCDELYYDYDTEEVEPYYYCEMELVDGISDFECVNTSSPCQCSDEPVTGLNGSSVCYDGPTFDPTMDPTIEPSMEPTSDPTFERM